MLCALFFNSHLRPRAGQPGVSLSALFCLTPSHTVQASSEYKISMLLLCCYWGRGCGVIMVGLGVKHIKDLVEEAKTHHVRHASLVSLPTQPVAIQYRVQRYD